MKFGDGEVKIHPLSEFNIENYEFVQIISKPAEWIPLEEEKKEKEAINQDRFFIYLKVRFPK